MAEIRPNPDALLKRVQAGRSSPASGKTENILWSQSGRGEDLCHAGSGARAASRWSGHRHRVVETHGRAETEALLPGLEVLPLRTVEYRGTVLHEFDLDAALARRPAMILIDELAHTNAPGLRHTKRWQDVQELLRPA